MVMRGIHVALRRCPLSSGQGGSSERGSAEALRTNAQRCRRGSRKAMRQAGCAPLRNISARARTSMDAFDGVAGAMSKLQSNDTLLNDARRAWLRICDLRCTRTFSSSAASGSGAPHAGGAGKYADAIASMPQLAPTTARAWAKSRVHSSAPRRRTYPILSSARFFPLVLRRPS